MADFRGVKIWRVKLLFGGTILSVQVLIFGKINIVNSL